MNNLPPKKVTAVNQKEIEKYAKKMREYHEKRMKAGGLCAVYSNLSKIKSIKNFYWKNYTGEWAKMSFEDKVELLVDVLNDLLWGEL